ncbi:MAG: glycosyltransferase [Thermoanaerobaculia bacterium]
MTQGSEAGERQTSSVERRLADLDAYQRRIAAYRAARAALAAAARQGPRIAVYTAIVRRYDSIKLPDPPDPRFDYVLFTDAPAPDTGVHDVRPITYFDHDPTRTARFVKTHPHLLLPDHDLAIWVDSTIMILGDIFPLVERFQASEALVAAVPHPVRRSLAEEVEACAGLHKDDVEVMRAQVDRYREAGFATDGLIESSVLMLKPRDPRVRPFLDTWWGEIDRGSKRDQLSFNYALARGSLETHTLTDHPGGVRDHPLLAWAPHDGGGGAANRLVERLHASFFDPYARPPYAEVREERIAAQSGRHIDIIVCVHDALEHVERCLESVRRARTGERQRLILVDDGSDAATARRLEELAGAQPWIDLIRNQRAEGYTRAANRGLAASSAELAILLNSDTVVTSGWAEKLADVVFSTPGAGIVGPLSNAAGPQSIPEHRGSARQTAINELPAGLTAEDMNRYCEWWTPVDLLPRTPLVHGFCFGVTRAVLSTVGLFDEAAFPRGYGEESDYCLRAADAGFGLVVATHTFVYHAKSKSYADAERQELARAGMEALRRRHGAARIERAMRSLREDPLLERFRQRARSLATRPVPPAGPAAATTGPAVQALIPRRPNGGPEGSSYIRVLCPLAHPGLAGVLRLAPEPRDSSGSAPAHDVLLIQRDAVRSPERAEELVERCRARGVRIVYEIDDDLFHLPPGHPAVPRFSADALEAMALIANRAHAVVVSTPPLKDRLAKLNHNVFVVPNALDERLWLPTTRGRAVHGPRDRVSILYVGTHTHGADLALLAGPIERLKARYGGRVDFVCIGGVAGEPPPGMRRENLPTWVRTYPEFARWMAHAPRYDIAVAPLADNEFNRAKSPIKHFDYAICGYAQVLSDAPAYRDVVRHGETGLLAPNTPEDWLAALRELIDDADRRRELGSNAFEDTLAHHTLAAQAESRRRLWSSILS